MKTVSSCQAKYQSSVSRNSSSSSSSMRRLEMFSSHISSYETSVSKGSDPTSSSCPTFSFSKRFWQGPCLLHTIWSSSYPSTFVERAQTLNDLVITSVGSIFQSSSTHFIICRLGVALLFHCAVSSCVPSARGGTHDIFGRGCATIKSLYRPFLEFLTKSWTLFGIFVPNGGLQSTILRAVLGKNGFHFQKIFQKF